MSADWSCTPVVEKIEVKNVENKTMQSKIMKNKQIQITGM